MVAELLLKDSTMGFLTLRSSIILAVIVLYMGIIKVRDFFLIAPKYHP